ncbi:class I SAM-dependent methyltransferase [Mycolicibacterium rufum]|uniref:Class I SAM-dependent methyltransferase n=1 Tax=Mycolicibacterium rufum TaxID=318424 RepID=A0A9X2YA90_9MYCO|nr:class I SAM-dependent methyltransferase [Mycolicibacterium rufum]KGI69425.1 SAM-dependent methyltransferase [Mycolicibacterium rufum]MCV7070214.1 class I SAM-dependent methyltransferase [Mycolicibacterium rufum]ULP35632.1 class I SAM-dependent methyltransferase [Mycolicibacterium rufum]
MTSTEDKLNAFLGKAIGDLAASVSAVLMLIGDELGLYRALAGRRCSAEELARMTGTNPRYIREWLANQAAGGYVEYDDADDVYYLTAEQELCLADPSGPVDLAGAYQIVQDLFHVRDRAVENFRTGDGMEWGEHHRCLFYGTERFFRAGYNANLISSWLPALDGVVDKLEAGGRAADVGCGHGASTILMAQAFPSSHFVGIDYHSESIDIARGRASEAGVHNASFEFADATSYRGDDYDLIAFFDCLHDMADPSGAARHARQALKLDGHCLLVEPFAGDSVAENLNPVGRLFYGASSLICVPVSLARHGPALGAQAGERRLREVMVDDGGFTRFRRATQTPFNLIFEARP